MPPVQIHSTHVQPTNILGPNFSSLQHTMGSGDTIAGKFRNAQAQTNFSGLPQRVAVPRTCRLSRQYPLMSCRLALIPEGDEAHHEAGIEGLTDLMQPAELPWKNLRFLIW